MKLNEFLPTTGRVASGLVLGLTAASSLTFAELPKGLVLHLNFDKQEGTIVADASGQRNSGQVVGAKWSSSGKKGGAYEFAGNNLIQVNNSPSLNVRKGTFAVWFKTSKTDAAWRRLLDKRGFSMCISGDAASRGKLAIGINGRSWAYSDDAVTDGKWHHGAASFDGANIKLFVDGQLQKQVVPLQGDIAPSAAPLTVGQAFDGAIDDVMVFNRGLTDDEAKGLASAASGDGKPPGKTVTKAQVAQQLNRLKWMLDNGLCTQEFYERRVAETKKTVTTE